MTVKWHHVLIVLLILAGAWYAYKKFGMGA